MQRRSGRAWSALVPMFAAMIVASCATTTAPRIAVLSGVSGSGQAATVGSVLPQPFVVRVEDQNGVPVEGYPVTWQVTTGGGTVTQNQSSTDPQGFASTALTLGPIAGLNQVTASIGSASAVVFTATGTAPAR